MRLALTDPLTGLGNHRHFHERLQRELTRAEQENATLSLCLVDVDDFKRVNDRFGHPVGDRVLGQIAARLRQGGESFRLGGDEFAVLLPGVGKRDAIAVARSIVERVRATELEQVGEVTVSAGVVTFPVRGAGRNELIRLADSALYWAKEDGKNRARAYEATTHELTQLRQLAEGPGREARYRAAASLAKAVDARDTYTGSHSERVGDLAARIARRLGFEETQVELTRLAASLRDLGKLAIPEEILRKPGTLDESERLVLQHHPQIGHRMLETLGVEPIADWVLHHHERWDGAGYPDRLRGRDPARRAHHLRRGRLGRDDLGARVRQAPLGARGDGRARALRRLAVRSDRRGRLLRGTWSRPRETRGAGFVSERTVQPGCRRQPGCGLSKR